MKFSTKLCLITFIAFAPSLLQAKVQKNVCIKQIADIFQHLPENLPNDGSVIAALDWDRTISEIEGEPKAGEVYKPREQATNEKAGTLATINKFQDKGIKTMVLTARMRGLGAKGGMGRSGDSILALVRKQTAEMLKLLGTEWQSRGPIPESHLISDDIKGMEAARFSKIVGRPLQYVVVDQIAFVPAEVKGELVSQFIDENKFSTKPTQVIFVDNKKSNIDAFAKEFENRAELVYVFYYPDTAPKPQKDGVIPAADPACT